MSAVPALQTYMCQWGSGDASSHPCLDPPPIMVNENV